MLAKRESVPADARPGTGSTEAGPVPVVELLSEWALRTATPVLAGAAVLVASLKTLLCDGQSTVLSTTAALGYVVLLTAIYRWFSAGKASTSRASKAGLAVALATFLLAAANTFFLEDGRMHMSYLAIATCSAFVAVGVSRLGVLAALIMSAPSAFALSPTVHGSRLDLAVAFGVCAVFLVAWRIGRTWASETAAKSHVKTVEAAREEVRRRYEKQLRRVCQPNIDRRILEERGELDGLWEWDLRSDEVYLSPRWRGLLGYGHQGATLPLHGWLNLIHPYDLDEMMKRLRRHIKGETPIFEYEHRVRQDGGAYRWVLSHGRVVYGDSGEPERLTGTQVDVTRVKEYEAELYEQATHDRLTGLPNRELLSQRLTAALQIPSRRGSGFALVFLDLDGFKFVNDSLGHDAGDELLRQVARRMELAVRETDLVARIGGDEFVALLQPIGDEEEALTIAERLREELRSSTTVCQATVSIDASIGVVMGSAETCSDASTLMRNADIAMYRAKKGGKGRVQVFAHNMQAETSREFALRNDLTVALQDERLELHYQPIVCAASGRLVAAEALMRWRRASGERVAPAEFIPLAEEMNLLDEMGVWAFRTGLHQLSDWLASGVEPFRLSVNLSPRQLASPRLVENLQEILRETAVPNELLELEITESALLAKREQTLSNLDRLMLLGVRLAIDDFGTGYSALSYLREIPCTTVKIDQSFTQSSHSDVKSGAIVRSVIALAHDLNLDVVGEGVETVEQRRFLQTHRCDLLQGFLPGRPVPAADFAAMLQPAPCSTRRRITDAI